MTTLAASFLLPPSSFLLPPLPARPSRGQRPPSVLGRVLRWLDAWEDRAHLHALSDHRLRDLGFLRDQIDEVLRGAVRRP